MGDQGSSIGRPGSKLRKTRGQASEDKWLSIGRPGVKHRVKHRKARGQASNAASHTRAFIQKTDVPHLGSSHSVDSIC